MRGVVADDVPRRAVAQALSSALAGQGRAGVRREAVRPPHQMSAIRTADESDLLGGAPGAGAVCRRAFAPDRFPGPDTLETIEDGRLLAHAFTGLGSGRPWSSSGTATPPQMPSLKAQ